LRSCQPPGSGAISGVSGSHGTPWADSDLIVLRLCVRLNPVKQISVRDGQERR
jgi:hypothetical protein